MRFMLAAAWLVASAVALSSAIRHRSYVGSLPSSPGNRTIKRQHLGVWIFGVVAAVAGLWNLVLAARPFLEW
jgi:hypothetical protein